MTVLEKVKEFIAYQLDVNEEQIDLSTRLEDDLNADSFDILEIVIALENEYDIEFYDEDVETFVTVQDIVDYIERNL